MSWRIHITISQEWMISFLGGVLQKSSDRVCSTRREKRKSSNQNISYINQRIVFSYAHSVCEDRVSFFIKKCKNICKIQILFVPLHCKKIIQYESSDSHTIYQDVSQMEFCLELHCILCRLALHSSWCLDDM